MSVAKGLESTSGYVRIGTISSIDTEHFRCNLNFPGSYAIAKDVPLTPSPLLGFMPEVGSNVAVFSMPGAGHRIISILDTPDGREPSEVLAKENKSGTIPRMETGDVYVGHRGRAYFNKYGDVRISSRGSRASLELKTEKAMAELYGYNFDLHTPGNNVRIRSKSTVDVGPLQTWGDSLSLEVNVPTAPALDHLPEVLPTNLGRIHIDKVGSVNVDVLPLTPGAVNLEMNVTGLIQLGRGFPLKTVGLQFGALGFDTASLFTPKHGLYLDDTIFNKVELTNLPGLTDLTLYDTGSVHLGSLTSYFAIDKLLSSVTMASAGASLEITDAGTFSLADYSLNSSVVGTPAALSLAGKNVNIAATLGALGLSASAVATLTSPLINLGAVPGGHVAFAEALVAVFNQLNILHQAIKAHTHAFTGVVTTGAGAGGTVIGGLFLPSGSGSGGTTPSGELATAGIIPPVPTAATLGSTTVTAQV